MAGRPGRSSLAILAVTVRAPGDAVALNFETVVLLDARAVLESIIVTESVGKLRYGIVVGEGIAGVVAGTLFARHCRGGSTGPPRTN